MQEGLGIRKMHLKLCLIVQFDIYKMLWSSCVVEEKKKLWIRVWLSVIEKHVEKRAGKITQTHIAFIITPTQSL